MTKRRFTPAYPSELRERGVRPFRANRADYASDTAAYRAIAPKLGCSPDSLRAWCQQAERDSGQRVGHVTRPGRKAPHLEDEHLRPSGAALLSPRRLIPPGAERVKSKEKGPPGRTFSGNENSDYFATSASRISVRSSISLGPFGASGAASSSLVAASLALLTAFTSMNTTKAMIRKLITAMMNEP